MHPNVHVVKLVVDDEESNKAAVAEIQKFTDRLDVVVANAGLSSPPRLTLRQVRLPLSLLQESAASLNRSTPSPPPTTSNNSRSTPLARCTCTRPPTRSSLKAE